MPIRLIAGRTILALFFLTLCGDLRAQRFSFQRYGETQGLTNLVITDLIQDRQGYIWAATFNGLFRYDGTSFERFGEKEGISTSGSIDLTETPDGELWAASERALFRREGKHFQRFDLPVGLNGPQSIAWVARSSSFLLATPNGLATASLVGGKLGTVVSDPGETAPVSAVYAAPDGTVWYTVPSGVCRKSAGKTACLGVRDGIPIDHWTAIREDRNGDLWIRSEKRLRVLRRGAAHFIDGGDLPPADGTGVLSLDRKGNLFVPTQRGLARMLNGQWKLVTMREGLTSGSTRIALEDHEGSLWIGHLGAGLERWRGYDSWEGWTDLEGLDNSSILAIEPAANEDLYLGTDRGLLLFRPRQVRPGKVTVRKWLEPDGLSGEHVFALARDRSGNLFTGSSPGGLSCLNQRSGRMQRIYPPAGQKNTGISSLAIDADGSIWAGSPTGLLRFRGSPESGFQLSIPPGTPPAGTTALLVDKAGHVWETSAGRLHVRLDEKWMTVGPQEGLTGEVLFVAQAEDGAILALNADAQAYRITEKRGRWIGARLPALPAPGRLVPYFVGSDARGAIWVGTDRGVFVLEPGSSGWRWHDEDDGLVWNDTNIGAFHRGERNDVWIGTSRGLAHYRPNSKSVRAALRTLISAVQVNGQTVNPAGALSWKFPVSSVQLRVTALTFLNESRTRFLYRRRGVDSKWLKTDSHVIMYSDLKPGTYTFDVLAESTDGVIGVEPASVTLTVLPPWFLTPLFFWLSVAGLLLLVFSCYRWRVRNFIHRQKELETAVTERTLELETERIFELNQHRVLEMIAAGFPIEELLQGIEDLVRSRIPGMRFSIHSGIAASGPTPQLTRRHVRSSSSEAVGWIDFSPPEGAYAHADLEKTVAIAIRLASVAIERANAQESLSYQAHHDSLTGLANRLCFQSSIRKASAEANRTGDAFALIYIDLDRFKQINDQYGHGIGDLYLQEVSRRFSSCMRKGDLLARLGGDEFAAIVAGVNSGTAAKRIVNALLQSLSQTIYIDGIAFRAGASVGFSLHPYHGTDAESLLHAADESMYAAKRAGRTSEVQCLAG